jgi:hypothetical protein
MVAIVAAVSTILIFIVYGFWGAATPKSTTQNQYYRMGTRATFQDYEDTTVAFSLQTAVTIYFVYWGYKYGLANVSFIITWGLGLYFYSLAAPRLYEAILRHATMYEFLSRNSRSFQILLVAVGALNFIALMYSELFMTSSFLGSVASGYTDIKTYPVWFWFFFVFLLFGTLMYVSAGAMRKVVSSDKWQLSMAYLSAATILSSMSFDILIISTQNFMIVYGISAAIFLGLAFYGREKENKVSSSGPDSFPVSRIAAGVSGVLLIVVALLVYQANPPVDTASIRNDIAGFDSMFSQPAGWAPLVGFGLANALWQFSDYTAYQRLTILDHGNTRESGALSIRRNIRNTALSSPLTWSIGIVIGLALAATGRFPAAGSDVFSEYTLYLVEISNAGSILGSICLAALSVFLIAVMLSTVDSLAICLSSIIEIDFLRRNLTNMHRTLVYIGIAFGIILAALYHVGFRPEIFQLLSLFYAFGLVLAPPFIACLLTSNFRAGVGISATAAGIIAAVHGQHFPPAIPELVSTIWSMTIAIVVSAAVTLLGVAFTAVMERHAPRRT